jgi:hypothetical protein
MRIVIPWRPKQTFCFELLPLIYYAVRRGMTTLMMMMILFSKRTVVPALTLEVFKRCLLQKLSLFFTIDVRLATTRADVHFGVVGIVRRRLRCLDQSSSTSVTRVTGVTRRHLTSIKAKDKNRLNLEPAPALALTSGSQVLALARQKQAQSSQ